DRARVYTLLAGASTRRASRQERIHRRDAEDAEIAQRKDLNPRMDTNGHEEGENASEERQPKRLPDAAPLSFTHSCPFVGNSFPVVSLRYLCVLCVSAVRRSRWNLGGPIPRWGFPRRGAGAG